MTIAFASPLAARNRATRSRTRSAVLGTGRLADRRRRCHDRSDRMNSIDVSRATTAGLDAGGHEAAMPGPLIYEYRPQITQVVEYGASADAVLSGTPPPAEGARFDFHLEGPVSGPKPQGTFRGWTTSTSAPSPAPSSTFAGRSRARTGRSSPPSTSTRTAPMLT